MTLHQSHAAPHRITMCEGCERVPVPVHFLNWGKYRGLSVCAICLAEEGIHLEEREAALWLNEVTPETREKGSQQ